MGGKAFKELGEECFPRVPSDVYQHLKESLSQKLKTLYSRVETPAEAPEKPDHGDIDFLVYGPFTETTCNEVKKVLGAEYSVPMEGFHTSNYAVPSESPGKYFQVDVHVCADEGELERTFFFHGYGDLGMILGLLARGNGLSLGTKGLKIHSPQADEFHPPSFRLSADFEKILEFFGLSMETWKMGFSTMDEIFRWVSTSRFFDPRRMSDPLGREKTRKTRAMYQSYLFWSHELLTSGAFDIESPSTNKEDIIKESLEYFSKKEEYDSIVRENRRRILLKKKFTGSLVMQWTGLYGFDVARVMKEIRAQLSDEEIILKDDDELKLLAIQTRDKLSDANAATAHTEGTVPVEGTQ